MVEFTFWIRIHSAEKTLIIQSKSYIAVNIKLCYCSFAVYWSNPLWQPLHVHTGLRNIHCARCFRHWTVKCEQAFTKHYYRSKNRKTEKRRKKFVMKRYKKRGTALWNQAEVCPNGSACECVLMQKKHRDSLACNVSLMNTQLCEHARELMPSLTFLLFYFHHFLLPLIEGWDVFFTGHWRVCRSLMVRLQKQTNQALLQWPNHNSFLSPNLVH